MVEFFKACPRLFALIPNPMETHITGQSLMTTPARSPTGTALYASLLKPSVEFLLMYKYPYLYISIPRLRGVEPHTYSRQGSEWQNQDSDPGNRRLRKCPKLSKGHKDKLRKDRLVDP